MKATPKDVAITYKDGGHVTARIGVAEVMEIERRYKNELRTVHHEDGRIETIQDGGVPLFESTLFGAWHALGKPGNTGNPDDFDRWVATIEDFDEADTDTTPTQPAAGAGSSANSSPKPGSTSETGTQRSSAPSSKKSTRSGNGNAKPKSGPRPTSS